MYDRKPKTSRPSKRYKDYIDSDSDKDYAIKYVYRELIVK